MIVCVVPVRDQPAMTLRFLECMLAQLELDRILVLDNGSAAETVEMLEGVMEEEERVDRVVLPASSIYELWNAGADYADEIRSAEALERVDLLVANNDVLLQHGAVAELSGALRSRRDLWAVYPDDRAPWPEGLTRKGNVRLGQGVARTGGLYGPCFMVALDRIPWRPLVSDTSYEWWFGDDHLAQQIEREGGKHGRVIGLPVLHENEGTARHHPETQRMRARDRRRWIDAQRNRGPSSHRRRVVPGTKVWLPGGGRRDEE